MSRPAKSELPKELSKVLKLVSQNIKTIRKQQGLSQIQLAEDAGISVTTLNEIESKANRDIRISTLVALAESLDASLLDLFLAGEGVPNSKDMEQLMHLSRSLDRTLNRLAQKKNKK